MSTNLGLGDASYQCPLGGNHCSSNSIISPEPLALKTLARSLSLSKARFALILVRCPESFTVALLQESYSVTPQILRVPADTIHLYPLIQQACDEGNPDSLFITGLDTLKQPDEFLVATNQMRDEFRRHFAFPLIFPVNDDIIQKLVKLAPDFYNWASAPISLTKI